MTVGMLIACWAVSGCATTALQNELDQIAHSDISRELQKVSHPTYRVEPPDILQIEVVNNIRPSGSPLRVGDALLIRLGNPEPLDMGLDENLDVQPSQAELMETEYRLEKEVRDKYISSEFQIQSDGMVHLGPVYGSVKVEGLTVDEAEKAVETHLKGYSRDENGQPVGLKNPQVSVELPDVAGRQQITGEHLVRPDGTVSLGVFGGVYVAGMTLAEVKQAIEVHLSEHIHDPEVSVDVLAYNSKTYYVITDGGGFGEQVVRLPCTGNETVLDAISQIDGLSEVSSKTIWLARPAPSGVGCAQIMDVHWRDIAAEGITTTNYQILPGDRIYIKADKLITTDNFISKVIAPAERIMGFILLGSGVQSTLRFIHFNNRGGGVGSSGF